MEKNFNSALIVHALQSFNRAYTDILQYETLHYLPFHIGFIKQIDDKAVETADLVQQIIQLAQEETLNTLAIGTGRVILNRVMDWIKSTHAYLKSLCEKMEIIVDTVFIHPQVAVGEAVWIRSVTDKEAWMLEPPTSAARFLDMFARYGTQEDTMLDFPNRVNFPAYQERLHRRNTYLEKIYNIRRELGLMFDILKNRDAGNIYWVRGSIQMSPQLLSLVPSILL